MPTHESTLPSDLRLGLSQLGLLLSDSQIQSLLTYLDLILKWNRVYNLTSLRSARVGLVHHLLDCLAIVPPLQRQIEAALETTPNHTMSNFKILDVGTGAGLPGVIVAICMPHVAVDCVDCVAKKVAFVRHTATMLKLPHLSAIHSRIEDLGTCRTLDVESENRPQSDQFWPDLQPTIPRCGSLLDPLCDVICSRALTSLPDLTQQSSHLLSDQGFWLVMKGKQPKDEIAALPDRFQVFHVEPLKVPGLQADRCAVFIRKA